MSIHNPALGDVDQFIRENQGLVHHFVQKYTNLASTPGYTYEDFYAAGLAGMYKAYQKFEPDKGAKFATFASVCILNEIRMLQRDIKNKAKIPKISLDSDAIASDSEGHEKNLIDVLPGESLDTSEVLVDEFVSGLTARERMVLELRMNGYLHREIAEHFGFSQSYIKRILHNIGHSYLANLPGKVAVRMTPPKITKEEYLEFREKGKSKATIAMNLGIATNTLYAWIESWGIETAVDERKEIEKLKKQQPKPSVMISATENQTGSFSLNDFVWVQPNTQRSEIRITKNGIRITGPIASYLNNKQAIEVGFAGSAVAFRGGSNGWKLKTDSKRSTSYMIPGKRISSIFAERGFQPGTTIAAEWQDKLGVILAQVSAR